METLKVVKITSNAIKFENGITLEHNHQSDCCESHELYFQDLTMLDFEGLEFNLTDEKFFNRIPDYGIELIPLQGHSVKIAGHGYNNGYYSSQLDLIVRKDNKEIARYDITECQEIDG